MNEINLIEEIEDAIHNKKYDELLKRQNLFAQLNVNHIDKYIKAYKEEPCSHTSK